MCEELKLWVDKGIPYEEVVNRLSERSMEDCMKARAIMIYLHPDGERIEWEISEKVSELRTTRAVLDSRPKITSEQWDAMGVSDKAHQDMIMEVHALSVEGYVRDFAECLAAYQVHGRN